MVVTVYRQPILTREVSGRKRPPPTRVSRPLQTFALEAELRPRRRVTVRFPFGDWIEFRDNGQPCTEALRDYVLATESVRLIRDARLVEQAEMRRAQKA